MQTLRRHEMTDEQKLASDRDMAQRLLAGTFMVEAKACRKCGGHAHVAPRNLELSMGRGFMGTAAEVEVALCTDLNCRHVAARTGNGLAGKKWLYGRSHVELVDGAPYIEKMLPQAISPKQRERYEAFLAETA